MGLVPFDIPRHYRICIATCLHTYRDTYRDNLPENLDKTAAQGLKKAASGWRALLENVFA